MEIIDFPTSNKWEWKVFTRDNEKVLSGDTRRIYDEVGAGWIYYIWLSADDPNLIWMVDTAATDVIEVETSFAAEYAYGGAKAIAGYRITKYDLVNKIYVMEHAPGVFGFPGTPFRGYNKFYLKNLTTSTITFSFLATLIKVIQ